MRQELFEQVPQLMDQARERGVAFNSDTLLAELSGATPTDFPIAETGCYAGHYYARVTANADIYYCCNQHPTLHIGSLHDTAFTALWKGERWQRVRQRLSEGRFVSGCGQCGKFDLNRKVMHQLRMLR
jgi:hypothetical protein